MRSTTTLLCLLLLTPLAVCARPLALPRVDPAQVTAFQRGVGLGLFATDPEYDYGHLLDEIVAHGATDVLVVLSWYQREIKSHELAARAGFSPSDATVLRTLGQARARGLRVSLMPIVRLEQRTPTEWRGRITPVAGHDVWFEHYGRYLLRMASLAEQAGVERFSVGSELLSLERHEASWRALIAQVRERYQGLLYYSANWDHFDPIRFWDALDEVGVTAYFELSRDEEPPTKEQLAAAWRRPRHGLGALAARAKRPVVITEVGYPSLKSAARYPWDETRSGAVDLALQALLYEAFCDAFSDQPFLGGAYFWNWFGFGGPDDGSYTPRKKPAADVMRRCLQRPSWGGAPAPETNDKPVF
jgi:hypothetical protein